VCKRWAACAARCLGGAQPPRRGSACCRARWDRTVNESMIKTLNHSQRCIAWSELLILLAAAASTHWTQLMGLVPLFRGAHACTWTLHWHSGMGVKVACVGGRAACVRAGQRVQLSPGGVGHLIAAQALLMLATAKCAGQPIPPCTALDQPSASAGKHGART